MTEHTKLPPEREAEIRGRVDLLGFATDKQAVQDGKDFIALLDELDRLRQPSGANEREAFETPFDGTHNSVVIVVTYKVEEFLRPSHYNPVTFDCNTYGVVQSALATAWQAALRLSTLQNGGAGRELSARITTELIAHWPEGYDAGTKPRNVACAEMAEHIFRLLAEHVAAAELPLADEISRLREEGSLLSRREALAVAGAYGAAAQALHEYATPAHIYEVRVFSKEGQRRILALTPADAQAAQAAHDAAIRKAERERLIQYLESRRKLCGDPTGALYEIECVIRALPDEGRDAGEPRTEEEK